MKTYFLWELTGRCGLPEKDILFRIVAKNRDDAILIAEELMPNYSISVKTILEFQIQEDYHKVFSEKIDELMKMMGTFCKEDCKLHKGVKES